MAGLLVFSLLVIMASSVSQVDGNQSDDVIDVDQFRLITGNHDMSSSQEDSISSGNPNLHGPANPRSSGGHGMPTDPGGVAKPPDHNSPAPTGIPEGCTVSQNGGYIVCGDSPSAGRAKRGGFGHPEPAFQGHRGSQDGPANPGYPGSSGGHGMPKDPGGVAVPPPARTKREDREIVPGTPFGPGPANPGYPGSSGGHGMPKDPGGVALPPSSVRNKRIPIQRLGMPTDPGGVAKRPDKIIPPPTGVPEGCTVSENGGLYICGDTPAVPRTKRGGFGHKEPAFFGHRGSQDGPANPGYPGSSGGHGMPKDPGGVALPPSSVRNKRQPIQRLGMPTDPGGVAQRPDHSKPPVTGIPPGCTASPDGGYIICGDSPKP